MITSAKEFVELRTSSHPEEYLRAATESAPLEVWMEVLEKHPDMKKWVAHNKTVPMEILERLALDSDSSVRSAVAMKNKLSRELMLTLARDIDPSVRRRIVDHKKASEYLLQMLAQDSEPWVSDAARERLTIGKA